MSTDAEKEERIFAAALARESSAERASYLESACGGDGELERRVKALLRQHDGRRGILDSPPPGLAATPAVPHTDEKIGTLVGRYKLLELIGEGGFGNVYLAEQQEPVRRRVALKIIKLGMDTRRVIARFEAERQALALMDHPHIAKVLDAGATESGRPYFVMDLVRGVPITEYCDAHHLATRERLQLFLGVCHAVQHAHQKGIIHRDIKPNNVLATQQDGQPVPKIIDFGVAKATELRLTEKTLFTEHRQLIGTPEYMSPEQATFVEADVDTRSDIYSLGVLLYELLVGATPFATQTLRRRGYDEICHVIRESEPPTPSKRLSTMEHAAVTDIARHRHAEPAALRKRLQGDLDWIVMKCLEKQRTRRYETAHGLARDIERHLSDEPVRAGPPSVAYRLQKFVRKHRVPVAAAVAVLLALLVGFALTAFGFARAERARQIATSQLYVSNVNSAYDAWEEGIIDQVRELLERHRPQPGEKDLRGFEWWYLWGEYQRAMKVPTVKQGPVTCVTYSPDGTILASAGWDGTVKLWHTATLAESRTLRHEGSALCVAFSPDGSVLASGGGDQTIRLWDPATGKQLAQLPQTHDVNTLAFSPNCKFLAAGGGGRIVGELKLWDVATHTEVATLSGHTSCVASVAFSPDGKILASGSRDRTIKLWDAASGAEVETLRIHAGRVDAVAFSHSGKALASCGPGSTLKLWDMETRTTVAELPKLPSRIRRLAFTADGSTLATAGTDSRVWLWDLADNSMTVHRTGHSFGVDSIAFSRDGTSLATGSSDGTVRIATLPQLAEETSASEHSDWLTHLAVCPADARLLAVGCGEMSNERMTGELVLWDVTRQTARVLIDEGGGPVDSVSLSPDGRLLAASQLERASKSGVAQLWDIASGKKLRTLEGHSGCVYALAFSPDGKTLASADWGRIEGEIPPGEDWSAGVKLWDVATGQLRQSVTTEGFAASSIAFSPDGKLLALAGGDWSAGEVKLWHLDRDERPVTLTRTSRVVSHAAFSPDGRLLAYADFSGRILLWNVAERRQEIAFNAHTYWLLSIAFSPDGKTLASGSWNYAVKLWHVATGDHLATLKTKMPVYDVAFFPDGDTLAAGCTDKSVILWHVNAPQQVLRARGAGLQPAASLNIRARKSNRLPLPRLGEVAASAAGEG